MRALAYISFFTRQAAGRQATNMTVNPAVMEGDSVNVIKIGQRKGDDKPRKCYNCGRERHLAIDRSSLDMGYLAP